MHVCVLLIVNWLSITPTTDGLDAILTNFEQKSASSEAPSKTFARPQRRPNKTESMDFSSFKSVYAILSINYEKKLVYWIASLHSWDLHIIPTIWKNCACEILLHSFYFSMKTVTNSDFLATFGIEVRGSNWPPIASLYLIALKIKPSVFSTEAVTLTKSI